MKIIFYTDPHVCTYSSIIRGRGKIYSSRLENCIQSINWVEELAQKAGCDFVVCGGDFWDKAEINSEEATVVKEIHWANCAHGFIVGNHEIGRGNCKFSSAHLFSLVPGLKIFDEPEAFDIDNNLTLCFLPYILEADRKNISEYFPKTTRDKIVFSHNDIKGIQMGKFLSQAGFDIEDIQNNCRLFLNGHLHNGMEVAPGVINLGNLTGQNFSEDASKYSHNIILLDTDTSSLEFIENPYAFNFYKIEDSNFNLNSVKPNSIISIKVPENLIESTRELIKNNPNIIESRILLDKSNFKHENAEATEMINSVDHLQMFQEFVLKNVGSDEIILSELETLLRG